MKSLFLHVTWKFSLFWRYFCLLSLVAIVFLIALTTSMTQSSRVLQNSYFEQAEENFYKNSRSFSTELSLAHTLITAVRHSANYNKVCIATDSLTTQQAYYFTTIQDSFVEHCNLMSSVTDGFIYFDRSEICITKKRSALSLQECFSSYYQYDGNSSMPDLIAALNSGPSLYVLPACNVSINGASPAPYLTVLIRPTASSQVFGFLYSTETILEAFSIHSLPEDTCLKIISNSGEVLFSYNEDTSASSEYLEFTASVPVLSGTAILGIPQSYFDALTDEAESTAQRILFLAVLIGVALCILFSYIGVKPFHFLIEEHSLTREKDKNEVEAIDSFLKKTKQSNQLLRSMLLSSVLARAFHELPIKESEAESLVRDFPIFHKTLQLAIIQDQHPTQNLDSHSILFHTLIEQLPDNTICEHMSMTEVLIIVQTDLVSYEMLQRLMLHANDQFKDQPRFTAGVSAPFTGLDHVSTAVRQALLCLPEDGARITALFAENNPVSRESPKIDFDFRHLQQELSSWNEKGTLAILRSYTKNAASNSLAHPEEIFYNTLLLLRDAARSADMSFAVYEDMAYQHHQSPTSNLSVLEEIAKYLFAQKTELQLSEIQQLSQNLVHYVKEHYSDPALSLASLAQEFCVSAGFVHKALISVSGTNFSRLLLTVRMEEAARLLLTTDRSNVEISEACGYPAISTFYRNFKNYYRMTPTEYKDIYIDSKK